MSWPLVADFARMLQKPAVAFRDPQLKQCRIEMDHLGQPKPRSGNFATVYRAYRPDGSEFAVKVFNRRADQRMDRYQVAGDYFKDRNVSCMVPFEYHDKGIRSASDGKFYPLLVMDWVPGVTLFEWARACCHGGCVEALAMGAQAWLHLVRELESESLVHGDLQHGNVMVSNEGYFKLVDYDCLSVPGLMGQRNLEIGLPPYQHPGRDANTAIFPGLDRFSSIYIYTVLRALAAAPHLWMTYVEQLNYDRMLFRKEDFDDPAASLLYNELMQSPDEQVRHLTYQLAQSTREHLQAVNDLDTVILRSQPVEQLLLARKWDESVEWVEKVGWDQVP
ncbi:MAG: hypothetical protein N2C14_06690, partial [Planctomycetales bacterium]